MLKIGHLVIATVVKALPNYNAVLTQVADPYGGETQHQALLPRKLSNREYRVGDTPLAAVFMMQDGKFILSQKSPQYFRKLVELVLAPLLQEGVVRVKRAAMVSGSSFAKVSVEGLNGKDAVLESLPLLKRVKQYTSDTITLIRFSSDMREYIVNALCPAPSDRVEKVIYSQNMREADVFVAPEVVGLFLGKGGVNVATGAKLTGVKIFVKTARM